jgi:TonB-linked SusC/RagA family outer membrane protein
MVMGRVVDSATGRGLSGVTIKVAGSKLSAITQDSGYFRLRDVPTGSQLLTVRMFGYRSAERPVNVVAARTTTVRVGLASVPTTLSGVVTTATGVQRRVEVGNDITVLNADSILKIAPVANLTDMLATRVPGLVVQTSSGIPGAPSRLRFRGQSSLLGSDDPIVIVDGIRVYADQSGSTAGPRLGGDGDGSIHGTQMYGGGSKVGFGALSSSGTTYAGPSALDQIDPNSIETIETLKGPSATAIYGSDAANGVIVITTKRGRAGPTHWTAAANTQRTTLPGDWPLNYFRFGHDNTAKAYSSIPAYPVSHMCSILNGFGNGSANTNCVLDSLVAYQALNDSRLSPLGTGWSHNGSLTVSGGSSALTYSVTGSASQQTGYLHLPSAMAQLFDSTHGFAAPSWMTHPDRYTTYGGTGSLSAILGHSGAALTVLTSLSQGNQQQGSLQGVLAGLPFQYLGAGAIAADALAQAFPNIDERAQLNTFTTNNVLTLNNWSPWHWLPITATAGLNFQHNDNNAWLPAGYVLNSSDSVGRYSLQRSTNVTKTATAGTNLLSGQLMSVGLGINVNTQSQKAFSAATVGIPVGVSVPTNFVYAIGQGPTQAQFNTATYGWYVVPQIRLNDKLFVSPGFRLDGGSASGNNGQTNIFPKMDVSWIAVDRQGMTPLFGVLTSLRPRLAFGIAGVQPGPTEQLRLSQLSTVTPTTLDGRGIPVTMSTPYTLGNTQIHPERSREVEGGADVQLWGDVLALTLTAYDKLRRDAIQQIPVAPSIWANDISQNTYYANVGDIRNRGLEASMTARLVDTRALQWVVSGNVSHNTNTLVRTASGVRIPETIEAGFQTQLVPGYPIDGVWARPIVGYADANGDGVIATNEVRVGDSLAFVGSQLPNYELSLNTSLSFLNNRMTVNTSVDLQQGMTQFVGFVGSSSCPVVACDNMLLNNPALSPGEFAAISVGNSLFNQTSIGRAQTVSVLRWNTLSVSYLVPAALSQRVRIANASLYLQGSNLALHTNYRGKDPNVSAVTSGNYMADTGQLPEPRLWSLGVRIGN